MKRDDVQKQWSRWRDQMEFHKVHGEQPANISDDKRAYQEVIGMIEGNILRTHIQSDEKKAKNGEAHLGKTFANEMESNVCPICLELMIPPKNRPMLLFPCGHTFCSHCLSVAEKINGNKKCSLCKKNYSHSAINIALQNLICLFTDNRQHINDISDNRAHDEEKHSKDETQTLFYKEKLGQLDMRLGLLKTTLTDSKTSIDQLKNHLESTSSAEKIMRVEKIKAEEDIERAQAHLRLVEQQLEEFRSKKEKLKQNIEVESERITVLQETIEGLQEERVKVSILMNANQ